MDKMNFQNESCNPVGVALSPRRIAAKISLAYAVAGWVWILVSDNVVSYLTTDMVMMVMLNSLKGVFFALVTAGILYLLVLGVETLEQLEILIQCRCDTIQGYLMSSAVPDTEAISFLSDETWPARLNLR